MQHYLEAAKDAARIAGALIRERFPSATGENRALEIHHKGRIDLVTEVDTASEKIIRERLLGKFPEHGFLGEEGGETSHDGQAPLWIVDPLDGTRSFAHGYPFVAVSIALEIAGVMEVGVIYDPLHDELFEAVRGQGAFLNGLPIHVSATPSLEEGLLVSGFPYQLAEIDNTALFGLFQEFVLAGGGIRRDGAAALDFCYLACGRVDAFWEFFLKPWDAAAGALIVQEAGGRVTTLSGEPFSVRRQEMLASNGHLHEEMVIRAARYLDGIRPYLG